MSGKGKTLIGRGPSVWIQKAVQLKKRPRGCHLVTEEFSIPEIRDIKIGLMTLCIQHTSASICLNENWDSDVRKDMETVLNRLVPDSGNYKHTVEGPDDMPAHVKNALVGSSISIPITDGNLQLGTWQGIYLCEHKNSGGSRTVVVTVNGCLKDDDL